MSYLDYYGLNEQPFSNAINNKFFFNSQPHAEALIRLRYAVDERKGLALLIGDIGTGKSTLAQKLLEGFDEKNYESALLIVLHKGVTPEWFLKKMAKQFGIPSADKDKTFLLTSIYSKLQEFYEEGKKVVVLIDEAQMLVNKDLMEEFRGFLNVEIKGHKLITFVFFGLPEMDDCLKLDEPLKQRVAIRYELKSLSSETTVEYILFRLKIAGVKRPLFTRQALEQIHTASGGIPRLINVIGDNSLLEGFLVKKETIDEIMIKEVANDLKLV